MPINSSHHSPPSLSIHLLYHLSSLLNSQPISYNPYKPCLLSLIMLRIFSYHPIFYHYYFPHYCPHFYHLTHQSHQSHQSNQSNQFHQFHQFHQSNQFHPLFIGNRRLIHWKLTMDHNHKYRKNFKPVLNLDKSVNNRGCINQ